MLMVPPERDCIRLAPLVHTFVDDPSPVHVHPSLDSLLLFWKSFPRFLAWACHRLMAVELLWATITRNGDCEVVPIHSHRLFCIVNSNRGTDSWKLDDILLYSKQGLALRPGKLGIT